MKVNKNYESELHIKDLLFHVLYKWWLLLLVGLIGGVCFGFKEYWGFEKYHRVGELSPAEVQYEADIAAHQKALEQAEKVLSEYEASAQENNGGREVSILMGIDPTNIWTAEKKYYLGMMSVPGELATNVSFDPSKKVLVYLSEAFSVAIDGEKLTEVFGTNLRGDIDRVAFICINPELKTLSVIGIGASKEEALQRKEFVDSYLLAASEKLSKEEKYSLELLSDSVGTKAILLIRTDDGEKDEEDLAVIQSTIESNYSKYLNRANTYRQNRDNLLARTIVKPEPKIVSKTLMGFLIGMGIGVVLAVLYYFFNGKLKTSREMRNRYDIGLLGDFTHSRGLWKGKGLDWLIEKLEFGKKTNFENELDNIAYLIDEAKDGKTLLLTGTLEEKKLKKVYDGLAPRLQEKGIELIFEPDYLHNSEAVAASRDLDSVLVAEEKYTSRIRDLNRMAEMLEIEDANVIGAVLL